MCSNKERIIDLTLLAGPPHYGKIVGLPPEIGGRQSENKNVGLSKVDFSENLMFQKL